MAGSSDDQARAGTRDDVVAADLRTWTWDELEAEVDRLEAEIHRRAVVSGTVSQRVAASLVQAVDTELGRPGTDSVIRRAGFDPQELRDGAGEEWLPWKRYGELLAAFEADLTADEAERVGASMLASRWLRFLLQSARAFTDLEVSLRWASRVVFGPGSLAFRGCEATVRRLAGGRVQIRYAPPPGADFPALWVPLTRGAVGRFADLVGGRGDRTVVEREGATLLVRVERAPGPTGHLKAILRAGLGAGALEDARAELRLRNRELQRRVEELEAAARGRERLMLRLAARREQQAVGRLAGGVAHDLNNLLTAMRMQLDLLRISLAGDREALREIEWMTDAVSGAAARARELLDLRRRLDAHDVAVDELEQRGLGVGEGAPGGSTRDALIAQIEALQAQLVRCRGEEETVPSPTPTSAQVSWRNVPATLAAAERIGLRREDVVAGLSWTLQDDAAVDTWIPWSHFNELLEQIEGLAGEEGLRALGSHAVDTPLFKAIGAVAGAFFDEADLFDWILRLVFGPRSSYFVGLPGHLEVHGARDLRVVWHSHGAPVTRALAVTLAGVVEHSPRLVGRPPAGVSVEVAPDRIEVGARLAPRRTLTRAVSRLVSRTRATREAAELRRVSMDLVERNQRLSEKLVELEQTRRQRKVLERRLEQVRPMVVASKVAADVAHEFNNALTVIHGHAALLQMHLSDAALAAGLEVILDAAAQATTLTQKLRIIGRGAPEETHRVDVAEQLAARGPFLRSVVGGGQLVVRTPQGRRCGAAIGAAELERILLNLVTNASEANATEVVVEVQEVVLDAAFVREHPGAEPGPHVLLVVRDDGQGMLEEVRTRAFEPYFSTKDDGTGVGLATVFGMVHASRGTIWVESEPDEGTSFRIYWPAVELAPPPPATEELRRPAEYPTTDAPPPGAVELLVIDDDEMLRAVLTRLVQSVGYEVSAASCGDEALALVRRGRRPALVISDVVMPGLRGRALAEALRGELGAVPILFVSGFSDLPLALGPGMDFLPKPFSRDELLSRVAALLQAHGEPRPSPPSAPSSA